MPLNEDLLSTLWQVTRSHLDGTYVGENSAMSGKPSFDFFAIEYRHSVGNRRYDLADFSSRAEEEEKSNFESMSIFSWVEALLEHHGGADFGSPEHKELELNLIRLTAMWGHTNGFRIGNHLEYFESIQDEYVLNHIMGEALAEKYNDCGVTPDNADWLVSKLSGEELNLLIRDDLSRILKNEGVDLKLVKADQYAWLQKIKDGLQDAKKNEVSTKNLLVKETAVTKQNQSDAGEMHQIVITEGSRIHANLAYLEINIDIPDHPDGGVVEILGCYCGTSGDWGFFHVDEDLNATVFDEPDFDTQISDIWNYLNQTEEARNSIIELDEESNILGLSEEGEIFIEDCFESESDAGIRYSKTASAEYDYIYEIQGQWGLSFSMN